MSRLTGNNAFSSFLRCIENSSTNYVNGFFTCPTCEEVNYNGKLNLWAVVLDGTVTGVLGTLPNFLRSKVFMTTAKDTGLSQYVLGNSYVRSFLNASFKKMSMSQSATHFMIQFLRADARGIISEMLSNDNIDPRRSGYGLELSLFFNTCV